MKPATTRPTGRASALESGRRFSLDLPFVSVEVRPPDIHMPDVQLPRVNRQEVGHAADVARSFLPPPERLVYYGGLSALAVFGVLEWPVAVAIGAGILIAQRGRQGTKGAEAPRESMTSARTGAARRSRAAK
jgi:hypothetical protein